MYDEHYEDNEHFQSVMATQSAAQGMQGLAKKGSAGKIAVIVIFSLIAIAVIVFLVAAFMTEKGSAPSPIVSSIEELP